jgi:hypothetical protein
MREKVNRRARVEGEDEEIIQALMVINRRKKRIIEDLMIVVTKKIQDTLEVGHRHRILKAIKGKNKEKCKRGIQEINKKRYSEMIFK